MIWNYLLNFAAQKIYELLRGYVIAVYDFKICSNIIYII